MWAEHTPKHMYATCIVRLLVEISIKMEADLPELVSKNMLGFFGKKP